jgi:hypothetical protein
VCASVDNQGIKALRKANKTLLKATLNNCKNITLDIDASEVIANKADAHWIKSSFVDLDGWKNGWFWFVWSGF